MVLNYRRDLVGTDSLKFCLVKRKEKEMKFMENVKKFGKDLAKATDKNSPAILTGIAVVGLVTTAVLAWKAAPKAQKIVKEHKERVDRLGGDISEEEKKEETVEVIKEMAPVVAPPIVMGAVTAACIIGSNRISTKRIAALSAAYTLAEKGFSEYQDKVQELIGEKKEKKVTEAIAEDHLANHPVTTSNVINTGRGNVLFYDDASDRYFMSSIDAVSRAIKTISDRQELEEWIDLNELYFELDLNATNSGDILGFKRSDGKIDIGDISKIADDGTPCRVLKFDLSPDPYVYSRKC